MFTSFLGLEFSVMSNVSWFDPISWANWGIVLPSRHLPVRGWRWGRGGVVWDMFGVGGGGAGGAPLASFWYLRPLGSCFAWFLAAMAGILFLGGGDWALGSVYTHFSNFANISQFRKILSFKSSGNSWGNFIIIEIKSHFTCGESNLY